jgi:hypothetical protein
MGQLTKKATILFPPKLYKRLVAVAREQKRSVGELLRDAALIQYGEGGIASRLKAVEELAQLNATTAEPDQLEEEIKRGALEQ